MADYVPSELGQLKRGLALSPNGNNAEHDKKYAVDKERESSELFLRQRPFGELQVIVFRTVIIVPSV